MYITIDQAAYKSQLIGQRVHKVALYRTLPVYFMIHEWHLIERRPEQFYFGPKERKTSLEIEDADEKDQEKDGT